MTDYIRTRQFNNHTMLALRDAGQRHGDRDEIYKTLKSVPRDAHPQFPQRHVYRGRVAAPDEEVAPASVHGCGFGVLANYQKYVDGATRFIPTWVKVAVAMALGMGTMIGWKRIVVTVGEKIGKDHLTYAQGAAAEITCAVTIVSADTLGLPVSTTHVLSSGVAGTMFANHSGLQWGTVRSMLMAWVLTLPASILISGSLFWVFTRIPA